jgi:hypothetical protein
MGMAAGAPAAVIHPTVALSILRISFNAAIVVIRLTSFVMASKTHKVNYRTPF